MKPFLAKFQIGKNGLTKEFLDSISLAFKNRKQVRISVLKSCCRERDEIKQIAEKIKRQLAVRCNSRVIGFTIILIKSNKQNL